ncbi:MAG: hypothetical protein KDD51_15030, partial [Bdellovibrionales bacterium]|nr:hypothetical protein [Bdellovibrionales bacterium]
MRKFGIIILLFVGLVGAVLAEDRPTPPADEPATSGPSSTTQDNADASLRKVSEAIGGMKFDAGDVLLTKDVGEQLEEFLDEHPAKEQELLSQFANNPAAKEFIETYLA